MKHAEFRKRVEALAIAANALHDDLQKGLLDNAAGEISLGYLVEIGEFEGARVVLEDIAAHPSPDVLEEAASLIVKP